MSFGFRRAMDLALRTLLNGLNRILSFSGVAYHNPALLTFRISAPLAMLVGILISESFAIL